MNDEKKRATDSDVFRFVAVSIVFMLLLNVVTSLFVKGWTGAGANTALVSLMYLVYAVRAKNAMLTHFLVLALVAGWVELAADWWLVTKTESLVYAEGPKIVESPIYMPFAWMLVLVQVGLVGQWLQRRLPTWLAALLTGAFAGLNIPSYESLAKFAEWWIYRDTPMILNAPYYIILGEFLIGVPLVFMGLWHAKDPKVHFAVLLGVVEGLVIWLAYWIAWGLVG